MRDKQGMALSDDLQIHLVELSKSKATRHNLREVSPLEHWAFFLRDAERLSVEEIGEILPDGVFAEAAGVLEMIARDSKQKMLYESRLKFQRDLASQIELAEKKGREEGLAAGLEEGLKKGRETRTGQHSSFL